VELSHQLPIGGGQQERPKLGSVPYPIIDSGTQEQRSLKHGTSRVPPCLDVSDRHKVSEQLASLLAPLVAVVLLREATTCGAALWRAHNLVHDSSELLDRTGSLRVVRDVIGRF